MSDLLKSRLVLYTACGHGEYEKHYPGLPDEPVVCPGGSSREALEQAAQYCVDHKVAWSDGGDCWAAGVNGVDVCDLIPASIFAIAEADV